MKNIENLNVLVLAAGKSQRIQEIAKGLPKPLINISGISILEKNLLHLINQGVSNIWINLHFGSELIQSTVEKMNLKVCINYSYEEDILGTAGAVRHLQSKINGPLLVVYGDSLVNFELPRLIMLHIQSGAKITMAVFDRKISMHTGIAGGGVEVDQGCNVISFVEGGSHSEGLLVNAGIYLINSEIIDLIPEAQFYDFSMDLFPALLKDKIQINTYKFNQNEYCLGIDTPVHFYVAIKYAEQGLLK
jgi:NDP-sugar pyrophosphorylase family protein